MGRTPTREATRFPAQNGGRRLYSGDVAEAGRPVEGIEPLGLDKFEAGVGEGDELLGDEGVIDAAVACLQDARPFAIGQRWRGIGASV